MIKKKVILTIFFLFIFFSNFLLNSRHGNDLNLLIITLDTTRADHIGCYNDKLKYTPNIDILGKEGVIFENCYSHIPLTLPAHSNIFTGKYPVTLDVRNNGRYVLDNRHETLAEALKKKGFYTFAVISSYVVASKFGLAQGFDKYDDSLDVAEMSTGFTSEIPAEKVFNKFKILLDKRRNKRFFGWIHFYDPHLPYSPPDKYRKKFENDLYLGEIAYIDEYVGKITAELKKRGLYKKTLIVIVGDHGEDKGEHKEYGHGIFCYEDVLRVPFIMVNVPGVSGDKRINETVTLIDIFPTLSEVFGISTVSRMQGRNLGNLLKGASSFKKMPVFFESLHGKEEMGWAPLTGVIDNGFKYISLPLPELYNITEDPLERNNLFKSRNNLAGKLDKKLADFYRSNSSIVSGKRKLSEKDKKHLASLGYISSFKRSGTEIDPKNGIDYIEKLRKIKTILNSGDVNRAERDLKKLFFSKQRIKTMHAYKLFDTIYREKKDLKKLIMFQKMALKDFPKNENIKYLLANSYFGDMKLEKARVLCEDILKLNKTNTQAHVLLAKIYLNKGDTDASISWFRLASSIEPKNIGIKRNLIFIYLKKGDKNSALEILNSIASDDEIKMNPDNVDLLVDLSSQFIKAGVPGKGIELLREISLFSKNNPKIYSSLGDMYFKTGRFDKAFNLYNKAIEVNRNFAPAYYGMGVLYMKLSGKNRDISKLKSAHKYFSNAVRIDPEYGAAYNGRGTANIFLRNIDDAISDLEKALRFDPGQADLYFNLGIIYLKKNNKKRANEIFILCRDRFSGIFNRARMNRLNRLIAESR